MRGSGESDKPAGDYTFDLYVDDLNAIVEELKERDIILIGESMGVSIAIKYVTKYPRKVCMLVLVGGTPKLIKTDDFPQGKPEEEARRDIALLEESYSKGVKQIIDMIFSDPGTEYFREWGFSVSQKPSKPFPPSAYC